MPVFNFRHNLKLRHNGKVNTVQQYEALEP